MSITTHAPISTTFFFFNDTATTEIYTLSLHDALPICFRLPVFLILCLLCLAAQAEGDEIPDKVYSGRDRKSTRLNSSHSQISYAVFCLKKKTSHLQIGVCHVHVVSPMHVRRCREILAV